MALAINQSVMGIIESMETRTREMAKLEYPLNTLSAWELLTYNLGESAYDLRLNFDFSTCYRETPPTVHVYCPQTGRRETLSHHATAPLSLLAPYQHAYLYFPLHVDITDRGYGYIEVTALCVGKWVVFVRFFLVESALPATEPTPSPAVDSNSRDVCVHYDRLEQEGVSVPLSP